MIRWTALTIVLVAAIAMLLLADPSGKSHTAYPSIGRREGEGAGGTVSP